MKLKSRKMLVALAGHPNCGKSTIFNMLTGSRQKVANFPGVTVEKKYGCMRRSNLEIEIVDLPGSYSMTSYTPEERVARDFLLHEDPDLVVAISDASNLERSLFFIFQLMEMNRPIALCLNMMDVAVRRGIIIDTVALSSELGIPVITTIASKGIGKEDLSALVADLASNMNQGLSPYQVDYGPTMEDAISRLQEKLSLYDAIRQVYSLRWLAIKLIENDAQANRIVAEIDAEAPGGDSIASHIAKIKGDFASKNPKTPEKVIAASRYAAATKIINKAVTRQSQNDTTLTDRIDSVVLHPIGAPLFLIAVLFIMYQTVMVLGTIIADHTFPYWQYLQGFVGGLMPRDNDLIREGLFSSLVVNGVMAGVVSILYYIPLFLALFAMLAVLEDTGYMPRIAFIMDRILRYFGLHGQSTLPLLLGGAVIGGCAVPATMATRAIRDEKARLITVLIMPLMNCMAKTPFYILIVGLFFAAYQGVVLLALSIFGFAVALVVARALHHFIVLGETTPFVMELPTYHLPTFKGVMTRTIERTWLFAKKIIVIVAPIMAVVWFGITFPGIGIYREALYDNMVLEQYSKLIQSAGQNNPYLVYLAPGSLQKLMTFQERYRKSVQQAGDEAQKAELKKKFHSENPNFFLITSRGTGVDGSLDKNAAMVARALQVFDKSVKKICRERRKEIIEDSWAGRFGKFLEPVTQLAGFGWQMNIAIISSFAAKESLVGTLGAIFSAQGAASDEKNLASSMAEQGGWTLWHALAILVFVVMFPPCLATLIVIRTETGSNAWTAFASLYPIVLGFVLAVCVFQVGQLL